MSNDHVHPVFAAILDAHKHPPLPDTYVRPGSVTIPIHDSGEGHAVIIWSEGVADCWYDWREDWWIEEHPPIGRRAWHIDPSEIIGWCWDMAAARDFFAAWLLENTGYTIEEFEALR